MNVTESLTIRLDVGLPIDTIQRIEDTLGSSQIGDALVGPALSFFFNLLIILMERSARVGTTRPVVTRLVDQVGPNLVVILQLGVDNLDIVGSIGKTTHVVFDPTVLVACESLRARAQ